MWKFVNQTPDQMKIMELQCFLAVHGRLALSRRPKPPSTDTSRDIVQVYQHSGHKCSWGFTHLVVLSCGIDASWWKDAAAPAAVLAADEAWHSVGAQGAAEPESWRRPLACALFSLTIGTGSCSAADVEVCKPDARPDEDHGTAVLSNF